MTTQPRYFDFDFAAARPRWHETIAARLFGRKVRVTDADFRLTAYRWRGKLYVVKFQPAPANYY